MVGFIIRSYVHNTIILVYEYKGVVKYDLEEYENTVVFVNVIQHILFACSVSPTVHSSFALRADGISTSQCIVHSEFKSCHRKDDCGITS